MGKKHLNLIPFFEGYVRNYRRFNLSSDHNLTMHTNREIEYFANLGELLGFESFVEDGRKDQVLGRKRPMDLSWWKYDQRESVEHYDYLALHLERESLSTKKIDTIDKLFSQTEKEFSPYNVIGIQFISSPLEIEELNELIVERNRDQMSHVLMVYRYWDSELNVQRVDAYFFTQTGLLEIRRAFCPKDNMGYSFMCFEEEYSRYMLKEKEPVH